MKTPSILIVEDEYIVAKDIKISLEKIGYTICSIVASGEEAITKAEKDDLDLVLMDIMLKGKMDGIEAAELIRSRFGIPVIFLSAYSDKDMLKRAKLALPSGYLLKPFQDRELKAIIEVALYADRVDTERKRAEEALRESEARFKDVSLSMADWIWEIDENDQYTFSSGKIKEVMGYEPDELLGKTPFDFMPEEEARRVKGIFRELAERRQPIVDLKNWNLKKDGSRICLLTCGVPLIDNTGALIGYRGVDKDITKDLQAEEKLKRALTVTEQIIENMPCGMVIVGKDKIVKKVNRAALAMMGHDSGKEIVGLPCYKNICPADEYRCPVLDLGQTVDNSEKTVIHKDGRHIPVYKSVLSLTIDGQEVQLEAFVDISELKTIENALRESEQKQRTIMETLADPVVVYDGAGKATYVNPAFTRVFGWKLEELLGRRIDFVPDESVAETRDGIAKVLEEGRLTGFETQRTTRDGRKIDVCLGAALLRDATGQSTGIVVDFQDITEEKLAKEELRKLNAELEQRVEDRTRELEKARVAAESASRAKSLFIANMSHELRTPLNGIIVSADLALARELPPEVEKIQRIIRKSGILLMNVVNNILDFSKSENDELELTAIPFRLDEVLGKLLETFFIKGIQQQINIQYDIAADETPNALIGDPGRLVDLFTNLLDNAVKFSQGEPCVTLGVESKGASTERATLEFYIKDKGIGIAPEHFDKIFDPFIQVDTSSTRQYGGAGMGLAVSKRLAERMGGTIRVESEIGKGSTFCFTATFDRQEQEQPFEMPSLEKKGNAIVEMVDDQTDHEVSDPNLLHELLLTLDPFIQKRKPKLCAEVIGKISGMRWPEPYTQDVADLGTLIKRYKFKEAKALLDEMIEIFKQEKNR